MENSNFIQSEQSYHPKHNIRVYVWVALVVAAFLVAINGYLYFLRLSYLEQGFQAHQEAEQRTQELRQQRDESPSTSSSTGSGQFDETSNWQTYRNEEYGFEFKYPGDWHTGDPGLIVPYLDTVGFYGPIEGVTMVSVFSNGNDLSLKDWLNQFDKNLPPEGDGTSIPPIKKTEDTELNGIVALKTTIDESGTISRSFYLKKNKTVIKIYQHAINSPTLNIYDQILSMFRFIETE